MLSARSRGLLGLLPIPSSLVFRLPDRPMDRDDLGARPGRDQVREPADLRAAREPHDHSAAEQRRRSVARAVGGAPDQIARVGGPERVRHQADAIGPAVLPDHPARGSHRDPGQPGDLRDRAVGRSRVHAQVQHHAGLGPMPGFAETDVELDEVRSPLPVPKAATRSTRRYRASTCRPSLSLAAASWARSVSSYVSARGPTRR